MNGERDAREEADRRRSLSETSDPDNAMRSADPLDSVEMTLDDGLLHTMAGESAPREHASVAAGDSVGRYVVIRELGAGAMGVVHLAYDPELDRRVALKLLHPHAGGREQGSAGRTRLVREAQALAQLSHPNVVSVHDVGTHDGRVYVAMEFVEGQTLREWIRVATRSRREILHVFDAAGRGLAAAHAKDLVHRDFKPENVIIGADGVVRVLDFGLARSEREAGDDPVVISKSADRNESLQLDLTRTGGLIGTPAYMSAEQHLGLSAGAKSNQFSFCVTLYEALYRERPFAGDTVAAIAVAVTQSNVRESAGDVPRWIRRVLLRGLDADPDARYPDMESLLAALQADPVRRRRKLGTWGVGAAVTGLAVWSLAREPATPPVCAQASERVEAAWTNVRAEEIQEAFVATGFDFAGRSAAHVIAQAGTWTVAWADQRTRACEATRIRGEQSVDLMDRRMICLDRALGEFDALMTRFENPTESAVEHAVDAISKLSDLSPCSDGEALLAGRAPLTGEARAEADRIDLELARVLAAMNTGEYAEGLALAEPLTQRADRLGDPATSSRAWSHLAAILTAEGEDDRTVAAYQRAYAEADVAGDDRLRARLAMFMAASYAHGLSNIEAAEHWIGQARSAIRRVGDPPDLRADLLNASAVVAWKSGDLDGGIRLLQEGIALTAEVSDGDASELYYPRQRLGVLLHEKGEHEQAEALLTELLVDTERLWGPDHPRTATVLSALGTNAYGRHDYATAIEHYDRSITIVRRSFGDNTPRVLSRLNNYAVVLLAMGRNEQAEAIHRDALKILEAKFGPDHLQVAPTLENLGNVMVGASDFAAAKEMFARSLEIRRKHRGPDHPNTVISELNLGTTLFQLGELDEAERLYQHTRAVWLKSVGPEHADIGLCETNLGDLDLERGRFHDAIAHFDVALRLFEAAWGADSPDLSYTLTGIGLARAGLGDCRAAEVALERALLLHAGAPIPDGETGRANFGLARCIVDRDPARARTLATAALGDQSKVDSRLTNARRDEIALWLARH